MHPSPPLYMSNSGAETQPPEVGSHSREKASVEIYRSVSGAWSWRVVALAVDASEDALRAAKALALELESELYEDLKARSKERRYSQQ